MEVGGRPLRAPLRAEPSAKLILAGFGSVLHNVVVVVVVVAVVVVVVVLAVVVVVVVVVVVAQ